MQFFGFSEFFYSMEDVLYMAGPYNFRSFARAAQVRQLMRFKQLQVLAVAMQ